VELGVFGSVARDEAHGASDLDLGSHLCKGPLECGDEVISGDSIWILALAHAARLWPPP